MNQYHPFLLGYLFTLMFGVGVWKLFQSTLHHTNRKQLQLKKKSFITFYLSIITLNLIFTLIAIAIQSDFLIKTTSLIALFFGMFHVMLLGTLPVTWLFLRVGSKPKKQEIVNSKRRLLLRQIPFIFPLSGMIFQGRGFYEGQKQAKTAIIPLHFKNLPPAMDGLKIFHLSDLHLGFFIQLSDLESILKNAAQKKPDIMAITGDFVDEPRLLKPALKLLKKYAPPKGIFYSLGNHEYYNDVPKTLKAFKEANIPALVNAHEIVMINGSKLMLVGLDDPQKLMGDATAFFENGFKKGMGTGDFSIALSHRPRAFPVGVQFGIDLMLAGHTHGGQIGAFSHLLKKMRGRFIKGHYTLGQSQLYVSSGAGNLFPFRVDCPKEAPIYLLKRDFN